jgi:hypothetical protein
MSAPLSVTQVAQRWGKSTRLIRYWCAKGVFPGAFRIGNRWAIPHAAVLLREGITSNAAGAAR